MSSKASCTFQHTCVVCFANIFTFAGELPKELGKLINLIFFNVAGNSIGGELYVPAYIRCMFADIVTCFAGELPKELGKLTNLTYFDVPRNLIGGELYVPTHMPNAI